MTDKQPIGPWQEAWLETLESGEFKQTKEVLCRIDKNGEYRFCCLGLAEEVMLTNGIKIKQNEDKYLYNGTWVDIVSYGSKGQNDYMLYIASHYKRFGMFDEEGSFYLRSEILTPAIHENYPNRKKYPGYCRSLAQMNDDGYTFKQIAKFCRKHPEIVFKKVR